jgi:predicted transcriptional regulator
LPFGERQEKMLGYPLMALRDGTVGGKLQEQCEKVARRRAHARLTGAGDAGQFGHMSNTLTVRLRPAVARRLEERARASGRSRGSLVNEALERALTPEKRAFMQLAGSVEGPKDLSQRKGFSRK